MSIHSKAICTALGVLLGVTALWLTPGMKRRANPALQSPPPVAAPLALPPTSEVRVDQSKEESPTARMEVEDQEPTKTAEKPPRPLHPRLMGILSVNVSPRYANVYVGGKLKGQTPLEISLPVGSHEVVIEDPEAPAERFSATIEIRANETTPLKMSLSPPGTTAIDRRRPEGHGGLK